MKGFTLLEPLIVLSIFGIFIAFAAQTWHNSNHNSNYDALRDACYYECEVENRGDLPQEQYCRDNCDNYDTDLLEREYGIN